ncbi:lipopolysaccharide biosynthesis protein [Leuconostoc citreum]|uniref:lipopolysaccharide biosynthesis protein n=2 Tax=Leuconostoc citreum TaxID=33964 RepID=UPI000EE9D683|nr:transporter [Leuconostoc citreum]MCJ2166624.1 transporter [Leuconostoc citreum]MCT3071886.1 transporter [Leuconostoc citreum]QEA36655.1 transporter [Leuconostoc citreum]QGN60422.1 transporter [Leuconostoc citreum]HCN55711.1 transporter [Leuconostoc citreum]
MSRSKYAMKNMLTMFFTYMLTLGLSFITRSVFIHKLGEQYLGLNGVFSSILSVLSISDLGLESVFAFLLYKPLSENDERRIVSFITLFKQIYMYVGIFIFISGLALFPFLPDIIGEQGKDLQHVELIYFIMLFNSSISYFFTFNRTMLDANQKNYVITLITFSMNTFISILQITCLYIVDSMVLYVSLVLLSTIGSNIIISLYVTKSYPFLKNKKYRQSIDKSDKILLIKNTLGGVSNKLGGIVVFASDNIIISMFVNLASVGLYSNYTMVLNSFTGLIQKVLGTLTSSIGNLSIESPEKSKRVFENLNLIVTGVSFLVAPQLLVLLRPLISFWLGERYILSQYIVLLIVINFVLQLSRYPSLMYIDAYGLQWIQKWKSLIEAVLNIAFSLICLIVFNLGLAGVIIGTILSTGLFVLWYEPFIVAKYALKMSKIGQFKIVSGILIDKLWLIVPTLLVWFVMHFLSGNGLIFLIQLFSINFFLVLLTLLMVYGTRPEFKYFLNKITRYLLK